jgi:hypothetical protein
MKKLLYKIKLAFFKDADPPLGCWIPYRDWHDRDWRDRGFKIIEYDTDRDYIKVGII